MLRCAAVYLHNAQLRNLCGARLLNRLDIGRATVVELDLREGRFVPKADSCTAAKNVRFDRLVSACERPGTGLGISRNSDVAGVHHLPGVSTDNRSSQS